MTGNLYKITNDINSKIYIGKTYKSLSERWSAHISSAFKLNEDGTDYEYNYKIYNALRKYGPEHFKIELIAQFDEGILEQKEQEYIAKYDSYHNGYNSTLGGDGYRRGLKLEHCSNEVVKMYNEGLSIESIAIILDTSRSSVVNILKQLNIEINHDTFREDKRLIMYDRYFNPIRLFENKISVADWMINETDFAYHQRTLYTAISNSCKTGCIRYGHRWQLVSDLVYEDKIFRTKFDKEAYIQGKPAYKPEGKQYWIVDGVIDSIININKDNLAKKKKVLKCNVCGVVISQGKYCDKCQMQRDLDKLIKHKEYVANYKRVRIAEKTCKCSICNKPITAQAITGMCNSCANVKAKGKSPKPSKEELQALINQGLQIKQIAELYGRTDSTVHYWINSYGLR